MDQIRDEKNTDGNWIEGVSIKEGMERLSERETDSDHAFL